jgi:hypothetical protein
MLSCRLAVSHRAALWPLKIRATPAFSNGSLPAAFLVLPNFRNFLLEHARTAKGDQIDSVRLGNGSKTSMAAANEYVLRIVDDQEEEG